MTLQQLYCFESIARNLSFSKASSELFISQPAVTHHLRNLEKELNVTLIIRDKHSVILTEAGTRFLLEVNDILAQLETAKQTIQWNSQLPEYMHIGFENTVNIHRLYKIFSRFHELHRNVRFFCSDVTVQKGLRLFNEKKLDLVFCTNSNSFISSGTFRPLFRGYFCCLMRKDDPLAQKKQIEENDLNDHTLIFADNQKTVPFLAKMQRDLHIKYPSISIHFSTSIDYTVHMIYAGVGIALLPDFMAESNFVHMDELVKIPFNTAQTAEFGVLYHKDYLSPNITAFLDIIFKEYPRPHKTK